MPRATEVSTPEPSELPQGFLLALCWLVALTGIAARLWWLGWLPGINGDECGYAIGAYHWWHGERVELYAPSSRPWLSPILWVSQLLSVPLLPAGGVALRWPVVLCSLTCLVVLAYGVRPWLGEARAKLLALLLAALPVDIVYSRISWDPSVTPVCAAVLLVALVRRRPTWFVAAGLVGVLSHPFFVLLGPVVWLLGVARLRPGAVQLHARIAVAAAFAAYVAPHVVGRVLYPDPAVLNWPRFAAGFFDVWTGEGVYASIVDPASAAPGGGPALVFGTLALLFLAWDGSRTRPFSADSERCALAAGLTLSLAAGFLALGSAFLLPGYERFAMPLLVPLVVYVVWRIPVQRATWVAAVVLCSLGLFNLVLRYFVPLATTGSRAGAAHIGAPVDPRHRALEIARNWNPPQSTIIAEDWWVSQPLTYYALGTGVQVVDSHVAGEIRTLLRNGGVFVAYTDGVLLAYLLELGLPLQREQTGMPNGRPVIEVVRLARQRPLK
jgi:hypothetical protein